MKFCRKLLCLLLSQKTQNGTRPFPYPPRPQGLKRRSEVSQKASLPAPFSKNAEWRAAVPMPSPPPWAEEAKRSFAESFFAYFLSKESRATAWAAIPSSAPVKPSFSSVVAFTFTWSGSTFMRAARLSRIFSM